MSYKENEIVIAKNRPEDAFGYPAKIETIAEDNTGTYYKIHFKGWNTRYDIWIAPSDVENMLFKFTPELEAEHKKLFEESKAAKRKSVGTPSAAKRRKSTQGGVADTTEDSVNVTIPNELRALLHDDYEVVLRHGKLAKLPAQYTVDTIITEYAASLDDNGNIDGVAPEMAEGERGGGDAEVVLNKEDMVQSSLGLSEYFNMLLGSQLLYAQERAQYKSFCVEPAADAPGDRVDPVENPELDGMKIRPSSIYGLPHLLRLFIRIGPHLGQGFPELGQLPIILKHIHAFLVFLNKKASTYYDVNRDFEVAAAPPN